MAMEIEHLIPESRGGLTEEENLWLACPACNAHKSNRIAVRDPATGELVSLFDPRRQAWRDHFQWTRDSQRIKGITVTGRATVVALHLNRRLAVLSRRIWVKAGWHPPRD